MLTGDELLEKVCEEIDYPIIRDATCPYRCEGCLLKRTCINCSDQISHCKAINAGDKYYCSDDCWSQDCREKLKPRLISMVENSHSRMQRVKDHLDRLLPFQKGNKKVIHFAEPFPTSQGLVKSMLRTYLDKNIKLCKSSYKREESEYNCFKSLLQRDRATFDRTFQILQEYYVDVMAEAETDDEIMEQAHMSKNNIDMIQRIANAFVGTEFAQ